LMILALQARPLAPRLFLVDLQAVQPHLPTPAWIIPYHAWRIASLRHSFRSNMAPLQTWQLILVFEGAGPNLLGARLRSDLVGHTDGIGPLSRSDAPACGKGT
jgi:hypothetical protein